MKNENKEKHKRFDQICEERIRCPVILSKRMKKPWAYKRGQNNIPAANQFGNSHPSRAPSIPLSKEPSTNVSSSAPSFPCPEETHQISGQPS
jgi:hypothetical protein